MKSKLLAMGALAAFVCIAPAAHATLLCLPSVAPGQTISPVTNDSCTGDLTTISGSILAATTGAITFTAQTKTPITIGTYEEEVLREASGTLDFFLQVNVTGGGPLNQMGQNEAAIESINAGIFSLAGLTTNVGTVSSLQLLSGPAGSVAPTKVSRNSTGATFTFPFTPFITVGEASFTIAVSTNATAFTTCTGCVDINTTDLGLALENGFEPSSIAAPVPEPVSIILLGTALALSAVFIRRRHASKA
jgi:hypothetical protein